MKKIALVIFFSIIFLAIIKRPALAQTALHFDVGYMFPLFGGQLSPYTNNITGVSSPDIRSSWGKGGSFGTSIDHKFNKYIDLELGVKYRYGASVSYNDSIGGLLNSTSDHLRVFVFSLGEIYNFKSSKSITPYIGAGVVFAVDDKVIIEETSNDEFGNSTIFNSSLTCLPSFGGYSKLGANIHLGSNFCFFSELTACVLSLTPEKLYVNSVTQNGNNITNTLMLYQQETDYSKNISNPSFSQLQPLKEMAQSIPASSWGINIGIVFNFGAAPATKEPSSVNN